MATGYHFHTHFVSRGKGQSAIAKAAYNARERVTDQQTAEIKDYTRGHSEVLAQYLFAPKDAPGWTRDREELWNEVEVKEDRTNSRLAREIEVSFPHQLNQQQREWVIKDFVRENLVRHGLVADVAIHAPDENRDQRNYHAHVLFTLRRVDADGWAENKEHFSLDEGKKQLNGWREDWAEKCGNMLERAGYAIEADRWRSAHLSLGAQFEAALQRGDHEFAAAVDHEPGRHLGPHVAAMEAKGIQTEVGDKVRAIEARNQQQAHLAERQVNGEKELSATQGEIRVAYAISDSPSAFVAALASRNIMVAAASAYDVAESREAATKAEERGRFAPTFREGEIVAVNEWGHAYRLSQLTTGEGRKEVEAFLTGIDRAQLSSIETTSAAAITAREQRAEQRAASLSDEQGNIRMAYSLSDTPQQFQEGLAERGLFLARATEDDHKLMSVEANHARTRGGFLPVIDVGDVVAIDLAGHVHQLNQRSTGEKNVDVQYHLEPLGNLPSVTSTVAEMRPAFVAREAAEDRVTFTERDLESGLRASTTAARGMSRAVEAEIGASAVAIGGMLMKAAQLVISAFDDVLTGRPAAEPLTVEQRRARIAEHEQQVKDNYDEQLRDQQERNRRDEGLRR